MKRGIPIALQAAGALLACLVTTLNCHPRIAVSTTFTGSDKSYYYNERGEMIYCDTQTTAPRNYVIRTCQTKEQIFFDWYERDTSTRHGTFNPAFVTHITESEAEKVEQLIRHGNIRDSMVLKNIVPMINKGLVKTLWERIPDAGKGLTKKSDFREYGGLIKNDTLFTFQKGGRSNPCNRIVVVRVKIKKWDAYKGIYHSHPSGKEDDGDCVFIQGPSKEDQIGLDTSGVLGYVFGMNKRSQRLYILNNKQGVLATLPFCWFLCNSVNK